MFGLLRGGCRLRGSVREEWVGHVCGLCCALGRDHGQLARLTTNYDAALLSVLYEAQANEPLPRAGHFCPLRPGGRAAVIAPHDGIRYAAAICVLMAATKMADHAADGDGILRYAPSVGESMARRWGKRAQQHAATVGFDTGTIEAQTHRQSAIERKEWSDFSCYAQPTELAVATAFSYTAVLASCPTNASLLHQIGRMYGRIMFLLDSYRDYAADRASGRFNALARCCAESDVAQYARRLFREAHTSLASTFQRLQLVRPTLARALLVEQLGQVAVQTLGEPPAQTDSPLEQTRKRRRGRKSSQNDRQSDCDCDCCGNHNYNNSCCNCCDCLRCFRCGKLCDGDGCCDCNPCD